jgi:hypothetical protein
LASQLVGSGSITFSAGTTSGGTQIILPVVITSASPIDVLAGEVLSSLGASMAATSGYEVVLSSGQNLWANLTASGIVTDGYVDLYMYGLFLSL